MDTYGDLAEDNQGSLKRNHIFTSYVNLHERGEITDNEFLILL